VLCHEDGAGYIGSIEPFDEGREDWLAYLERLWQYFLVNGIAGERQLPAFLSIVGRKMYGLLRNLTVPEKPCTKPYGELVKILQNHLYPKPSISAQRFRFHKRDERDG